MKKTLTISTVVLALGAGAAGIALAGPGGKGFDRLDADSNGVVTMEEAKAAGAKHFAKLDKDKSGGLSTDEMDRGHGKMGGKKGGKHHGKGAPSEADREARIEARFERLDLDKSGSVTLDEMKQAAAERREKREAHKAERFAMMDTDKDGTISEAEFVEGRVAMMFGNADADGNGELTRDEMQAAHEAMRAERHGKSE